MTEEKLTPEQEAAAKLEQEGASKVVSYEDFVNLQKGVEKLAAKLNGSSKEGGSKEGDGEPEPKPKTSYSSVVKTLYTDKHPEINLVWDEMLSEATALGQDPIDYYESKKGWQLEAKARAEAEREKESAKDALNIEGKPSVDARIDFSKITPEQISKLSEKQREQYRVFLRGQNTLEIKRVE